MDAARRGSRMVIDPKVRQVGFVTPGGSEAQPKPHTAAEAAATEAAAANSPSPVMIPPPRHAPDNVGTRAVPMPVPGPVPTIVGHSDITMLAGSYNPGDSVLGTSPSSRNGTERGYITLSSEDMNEDRISPRWIATDSNPSHRMPHGVASVPSSSMDLATMRASAAAGSCVAAASLPPIATMPPPEKLAGGEDDSKQKPLKERTSKAERRALQEAQRAAKAAAKVTGENKGGDGGPIATAKEAKVPKPPQKKDSNVDKRSVTISEKKSTERSLDKDKKKDIPAPRMQFDDEHRVAKAKRRSLVEQTETKNRVELFRHLPQFLHGRQLPALEAKFFQEDPLHPHPAVYKVGLQYLTGDIVGGNARCIEMLSAFQEAIKDYVVPPEKTLVRDLTAKVNIYISFLITCRPLSISMGNAIKFLKARIAKLAVTLSESEAKASLLSDINRFIYEKIVFADRVIVKHAVTKIRDGDVLLTYGSSCVVEMILLHAHELGRKFRVVVVDSRPKLEGKTMLRKLLAGGLNCTYTHINAISYIMQEVTKVFLGAASVLSNGTVYSRVGTACVAMVAHASHVPVLICCEAYKFHERVQLDSICSNELGDPDVLAKVQGRKELNQLEGWTNDESLRLLNLTYDATPADYVSMIVTDYGMVRPS
ncbi:hypothetical protein SUGI_0139000 [Cryptomeria japonica]|nr:hypothetical protein SUGI_0139000 [Cryptomeria japonica]